MAVSSSFNTGLTHFWRQVAVQVFFLAIWRLPVHMEKLKLLTKVKFSLLFHHCKANVWYKGKDLIINRGI